MVRGRGGVRPQPQTAGTITSLLTPLDLVFTGLASDPAQEDCAAGPRLRDGHRDENLRELNALFEVWRADCRLALVLTVPSGRLDSVEKTEDLKSQVAVAEERLRDRQGLLFR
jgi:hypothetical protein